MMPRLRQVRRRIVEYVRGDHELTVWFADAVFHLFGKVIGAFFADEPVQRDLAAVGGAELDRDGVTRTLSLGHGRLQDRKSTRLNSSHTVISYAVFCLKKKKDNPCRGSHDVAHSDSERLDHRSHSVRSRI